MGNPMLLHVISSMDPLPPVHGYQYLPIHSSVSPSPPTTPLHEDSHSHNNTSGGDDDDDEEDPLVHSKITMTKYQHIMDMISQPAVKISGASTSPPSPSSSEPQASSSSS